VAETPAGTAGFVPPAGKGIEGVVVPDDGRGRSAGGIEGVVVPDEGKGRSAGGGIGGVVPDEGKGRGGGGIGGFVVPEDGRGRGGGGGGGSGGTSLIGLHSLQHRRVQTQVYS